MQDVRSGRRSTSAKRARRDPAPVAVRYACPICGGDHRRDEHGLHRLDTFRQLSPHDLRDVRQQALEELWAAVRGAAEPAARRAGLRAADGGRRTARAARTPERSRRARVRRFGKPAPCPGLAAAARPGKAGAAAGRAAHKVAAQADADGKRVKTAASASAPRDHKVAARESTIPVRPASLSGCDVEPGGAEQAHVEQVSALLAAVRPAAREPRPLSHPGERPLASNAPKLRRKSVWWPWVTALSGRMVALRPSPFDPCAPPVAATTRPRIMGSPTARVSVRSTRAVSADCALMRLRSC